MEHFVASWLALSADMVGTWSWRAAVRVEAATVEAKATRKWRCWRQLAMEPVGKWSHGSRASRHSRIGVELVGRWRSWRSEVRLVVHAMWLGWATGAGRESILQEM